MMLAKSSLPMHSSCLEGNSLDNGGVILLLNHLQEEGQRLHNSFLLASSLGNHHLLDTIYLSANIKEAPIQFLNYLGSNSCIWL